VSGRARHVVVGGGLAGAKAAATLREEGFDGEIVLVGEESERPYERPALSKELLRGESEREKVFVHEPGFYEEHGIELRTGVAATALAPQEATVRLSDGSELRYDRLLLATGAEPRRPPLPGIELDGVLTLRTLAESEALHAALSGAGRLAVLGAGWIGCEVAASARALGVEVTVLEPLELPLVRSLGPELGRFYRDVHADHGVRLLLGTGAERLDGAGRVERVITTAGEAVDCDLVLVAVGVAPRVELAATAGLEVDNGILVDERLQTSAPGVFAAGDVANAVHPLFGGRIRVEHWANALNQGPAAARNMLRDAGSYERLPYFYSDQYDVGMEYSGHAAGADRVVFRGDPAGREFIAFWLAGDRLVAAMNVNVWDVTDPLQHLIRARIPVADAALTDPDVPLESLAEVGGRA
jgi:3-phenylpropionate/trans-cinnamate dioxygenase ferredoxin reductase subunit